MYKDYAISIEANGQVLEWIDTILEKYLAKHNPSTSEVEHIIDYLSMEAKKPRKMSYKDAKIASNKWDKKMQKKGEHIKETEDDVKVIHDFKDGFKIVQLIGKKAYEREGFLMKHCVGSYSEKEEEIYSLRDKKNMPHCTMSKTSQQIKGKGNGDIHPKYINHVLKFLKLMKIEVRDSEMSHLGYKNMEWCKKYIKNKLFNGKYMPKKEKIECKRGYVMVSDIEELFKIAEKQGKNKKK